MPELPEVETTRRGIAPHILGQCITELLVRERRLRWPVARELAKQLRGQRITAVTRRGKYLLLRMPAGSLIIHLGMSGSLRLVDTQSPVKKHDHLDIVFEHGQILRYHDPRRFGCVLFTQEATEEHFLLKDLGVEPLERGFTGKYLYALSRGRSLAVKLFIMNSHIVVGVGNIYASEALFLAGIHPKHAAGKITLERYNALAKAIKQVLRASIQQGGTTLRDFVNGDGKPGYFRQQLRVYGRAGEPCRQCQQPIRHIVLGKRATYYCTHCQT
jgi:formamidopyrimidine-DNA glycosylase